MPKAFALVCLFALALSAPRATHARQKATDFAELEATVNDELKATNTPGAAVAVVSGDRVVFAKGFGVADVETGAAVTPDTLFRIASTTKMLTAAALVTLAERGEVKLDAPVGTYVRGLSPGLARVTLHQLLSHTAGVRDDASFNGPHDDAALAAFVGTWTDDYLLAGPGEIYSYSNLGYQLAARVLEEATGKPYADAMDELVFRPLGMRRTTLRPTVAMTYPHAQAHDLAPGGKSPSVVRPFPDDARYWANGGVFTSAADFARFAVAFLNGGRVDGAQVMPPGLGAKLSTPYAEPPGTGPERARYGYGLVVRDLRGARVVQHGGSMLGSGSLVRMVPERRFAVIVLADRTGALLTKTMEKATEMFVPLGPKAEPAAPAPVPMSEAEMRRYAGTYQNAPGYLKLELYVEGGRLLLRQLDRPGEPSEVVKLGEGHFSTADGQDFYLISVAGGGVRFMHV